MFHKSIFNCELGMDFQTAEEHVIFQYMCTVVVVQLI